MNLPLIGLIIRRERLKRNWSQEGLCKGICAVSYLSKIEQGQANPSPEMVQALFDRLRIAWLQDENRLAALSALVERGYEAFFAGDEEESALVHEEMNALYEEALNSPYRPDTLLFLEKEMDSAYLPLMSLRQKTLWLINQDLCEEAININPIAACYASAGGAAYSKGEYVQAIPHLQRAYDLAARDGLVYIMMHAAVLLGNCYSDMLSFDEMAAHYQVARRLAKAVNNAALSDTIAYNTAATQLEVGKTRQAYDYFSTLPDPTTGSLHKLAICCEKLGKKEEAFAALKKLKTAPPSYPDRDFWRKLCEPVHYRLTHPDYLKHEAYGTLLLNCFQFIRKNITSGYATFHLPWVLEWYKATRQYKQAYELLLDFPSYSALTNT